MGPNGCGARFGDKSDAFALERVGHLLREERLQALYALAYGLKKGDFDPAKIAGGVQPEKKPKTDEDKLSAALKRSNNDG